MKISSIHQLIRLGDDIYIFSKKIDRLVNQERKRKEIRLLDQYLSMYSDYSFFLLSSFFFVCSICTRKKKKQQQQRCSFLHHQSFTFIALCVLYFAFFFSLVFACVCIVLWDEMTIWQNRKMTTLEIACTSSLCLSIESSLK